MIAGSFEVGLTLLGPVLTQSTSQGRWGLDAMMARSGDRYYLPGTLLKGLIAEAWQELECGDAGFLRARLDWLGEKSEKRGTHNEPARGMLFFEDLVDPKPAFDMAQTLVRIEIDPDRCSVKKGHYKVAEAPYQRGQAVTFQCTLWALANNRASLQDVHKRVQTALRWIRAAGSERTIGFGQVAVGECGPLTTLDWKRDPAPRAEKVFDLALEFTRPVCFAKRKVAGNLFESEEWIAGGTLKGALATVIAETTPEWWPELKANLHAVHFTHALPGPKDEERAAYPAESLVLTENKVLKDAIFEEIAETDRGKFRLDWKDKDYPEDFWPRHRWKKPEREIRVRTAIEGENRRAKENDLFAYEMLLPKDKEGKDVVWRARVHLDGVDESVRSKVAGQLHEAIQHGLFAMGKTKAHASVKITLTAEGPIAVNGGKIAVKLQTSALLCAPDRWLAPYGETGSTDAEKMRLEYETVWRELSDGALTLENYFHRQSLAGGGYLRNRFQHGHPDYRPYLLTEPGSVFLLEVNDAGRAKALLEEWHARGLPLTPAVKRFYRLDSLPQSELWQFCPYLPENGFGEIAIHEREASNV